MARSKKNRRTTDWRKTLFLVLSLIMVLTMILTMFLVQATVAPK
jgi:hypothetical protein